MSTELERRQMIWRAVWQARGSAPTTQDFDYWLRHWDELEARGRELNDPSYTFERMIGRGAGGADMAAFGPFAIPPRDFHTVPPYPPELTDSTPAPPTSDPNAAIVARLEELEAAVLTLTMRPAPVYVGATNKLPFFGVLTLKLTPEPEK